MTTATACGRCKGTETRPAIHFRPDNRDMTLTACGLRPWEVEPAFATSIGERVDCAPCLVGREARHRRREIDEFYAMDLEHDLDDGDHRPWFWRDNKHREEID